MTITDEATTSRVSAFTAALREAADWFDAHPEMVPYQIESYGRPHPFSIGFHGEDAVDRFAEAVRALGGARTKDADETYMRVSRTFGPGVVVELWAMRDEVCEAVVVGTETVIEDEVVTPAVTRRVEVERDVIEWRCAPVLSIVE